MAACSLWTNKISTYSTKIMESSKPFKIITWINTFRKISRNIILKSNKLWDHETNSIAKENRLRWIKLKYNIDWLQIESFLKFERIGYWATPSVWSNSCGSFYKKLGNLWQGNILMLFRYNFRPLYITCRIY